MALEMTREQFQEAIKTVVDEALGDDAVGKAAGDAVDKYVKGVSETIRNKTAEEIQKDPVLRMFSPTTFEKEAPDPRTDVQKLGACMRYLTAAGADVRRAAEIAEKAGDLHTKSSLLTTEFNRGGSMVPETMVMDFFEALRPRSVVRAAGARVLPMPGGTVHMPGVTDGSSGSYGAEGSSQDASTLTTGSAQLTKKRLMSIIIMSIEMLDIADVRMDEIVARDMLAAVASAEDAGFLNGSGASGNPLGIFKQALAANIVASSASTIDQVKNELKTMRRTLRAAEHVKVSTDGSYMFDTDIEEDLMELFKGDFHLYPEMAEGRIRRYNYEAGNNVPTGNIGFADMTEVFIGQSDDVAFEIFRQGDVTDSAGNTVKLINTYQAAARIVTHNDIGLRRKSALALRTGVDYSAL